MSLFIFESYADRPHNNPSAGEKLCGHAGISLPCTFGVKGVYRGRMLKKAVQQGRRRARTGGVPSGAHGATNKEHHVCARRRIGEAAGSPLRILAS